MSDRDRFWSGQEVLEDGSVEGALLLDFLRSIREVDWPPPKVETWPGGQAILDQEPEVKARIVILSSGIMTGEPAIGFDRSLSLKSVVTRLLRSRLPFSDEQLAGLARDLCTHAAWDLQLPVGLVVRAIEHHADQQDLSEQLRGAVLALYGEWGRKSEISVARRLRLLLGEEHTLAADPWGRRLDADLARMPEDSRQRWRALLEHAASAAGKTRPTRTWARRAAPLVSAIGAEETRAMVAAWLEGWTPGPAEEGDPYLGDANTEVLRGLLWAAAPAGGVGFAARVGALAEACFRKLRWHGPRSPRLGNGCLVALGRIGDHQGIAELSRLEGKARYQTARRMISSTLEKVAEAAGLTRVDLEEIGVPDYGLDAEGRRRRPVGGGEAEIAVEGDRVALRWHRQGRVTKGAPKAIREADPAGVKEARRTAKELQATLSGQAGRIERFYLYDRDLAATDWRQRYLDHGLVATVARRLVWVLHRGDRSQPIMWRHGAFRDLEGGDVEQHLDAGSRISLWHPVRSSASEVREIRRLLVEAEVTQPFKQAHREVYLLTDAERATGTYSNRFAAHILRQHQFHALCQQRDWKYQLLGAFDFHNVPERRLPEWDLRVEFWVEAVPEHTTEMGIFQYLTSDQVRFQRRGQPLELAEVPELAFSELMRDVDLFTSVCSVGNDPHWQDQGDIQAGWHDYWEGFAFGDLNATAETRREVLGGLLPRLKIADRCCLEDRWLVVRGDLETYRIHLRSGHVMMEPNRYLCIVPDRSSGRRQPRLYLPFEGDSVLSLILSKAFLLAEDRKIEDAAIRSQIEA